MAEAGITNAGAYIRKMALNGYVLNIDLAPVRELVSLQRRCSNNLNQVAIHANTYVTVKQTDTYSAGPQSVTISPKKAGCGPRYLKTH